MKLLHVELLETISKANEASCGIIIHLPSRKVKPVPSGQRFIHSLLPFPAHAACPSYTHYSTVKTIFQVSRMKQKARKFTQKQKLITEPNL
jgi:hypothetical protein